MIRCDTLATAAAGRWAAPLAEAAIRAGHEVTLILGPVTAAMPSAAKRFDVETARQMYDSVMREFPGHDLLIMAAAVADYRPKVVHQEKMSRGGTLTIECEATEDIVAAAGQIRRANQRTVAFSLEGRGNVERARQKLLRKKADLIVYNPTETMSSKTIESMLIYPDGRTEELPCRSKADFADILIARATGLFAQRFI